MIFLKIAAMLVLVTLMIMAGPWCMIWAINTLVAAGGVTTFVIEFNFWTWLAAMLLGGLAIIPKIRRG